MILTVLYIFRWLWHFKNLPSNKVRGLHFQKLADLDKFGYWQLTCMAHLPIPFFVKYFSMGGIPRPPDPLKIVRQDNPLFFRGNLLFSSSSSRGVNGLGFFRGILRKLPPFQESRHGNQEKCFKQFTFNIFCQVKIELFFKLIDHLIPSLPQNKYALWTQIFCDLPMLL